MPRHAIRKEVHSSDMPIDQKRDMTLNPEAERDIGDIVRADNTIDTKEYKDRLAFMEEPVTIRIEPGAEENSPTVMLLCVNGRGCDVLQNDGKWKSMPGGYVPIGVEMTIKRKYLEVLARSKIDNVTTVVPERGASEGELREGGKINRRTRQSHAFSILLDANPLGRPWLQEVMRRNV